ncbi:ATPase domain-containing protein [Aeropyrum camini]|uniref:Flagellar accessory protein FlaH n=1 Tax=Aeropyrum camini SY1 = JCM 12091 TaxID=1198449 RepID=U3TH69_9CREN|nr:ATPase domain-containing protein [Aeropyrum camini]BAN90664.1 flagellar accessory protein FlaH [Aeropyrum camini SY1 = JCM 12091]
MASNGRVNGKVEIVPTGNEEFDIKLGGGVPFPSLLIIEGPHGTGKTALSQLFLKGALDMGLRGLAIVTESTIRGYILKSEAAGISLTEHFLKGRLDVYSTQFEGSRWGRRSATVLLDMISRFLDSESHRYEVLVVDSLSHMAIYSSPIRVLNFFNTVRLIADRGKLVILTLHEGVLREDLTTRARATCDGYMKLSLASLAGKTVKVLKIVKLKGARSQFDPTITFDVDPSFGIKLVPIALASV